MARSEAETRIRGGSRGETRAGAGPTYRAGRQRSSRAARPPARPPPRKLDPCVSFRSVCAAGLGVCADFRRHRGWALGFRFDVRGAVYVASGLGGVGHAVMTARLGLELQIWGFGLWMPLETIMRWPPFCGCYHLYDGRDDDVCNRWGSRFFLVGETTAKWNAGSSETHWIFPVCVTGHEKRDPRCKIVICVFVRFFYDSKDAPSGGKIRIDLSLKMKSELFEV